MDYSDSTNIELTEDGAVLKDLSFLDVADETPAPTHAYDGPSNPFEIVDLLNRLDPEAVNHYPRCYKVGQILHNTDAESLFPIFDQWCSRSPKYKPEWTRQIWAGYYKSRETFKGTPLTLDSLRHMVDEYESIEPWYQTFADFRKSNEQRATIVEGLLKQGDTMNVVAPAKSGKTFFLAQLAFAILSGQAWLGLQTNASSVLYIDNELHPDTIRDRFASVAKAMGIDANTRDSLVVASLRGNLLNLKQICDRLKAEPGKFAVVVLDSLYRTLGDTDENSNGQIKDVYNMIDDAAKAHGCAFIIVHHTSKGSQQGKATTDVGSGAGAQSRACDAHLVLRRCVNTGLIALDAALRAFPPFPTTFISRKFPLFEIAEGVTADDVQPKDMTIDEFVTWLADGEQAKQDVIALLMKKKVTRRNASLVITEAVNAGLVQESVGAKGKKFIQKVQLLEDAA